MRMRFKDIDEQEIPMGPMIDMVFLLLIFFMVTAKPIKPEADIHMSLPGTVPQDDVVEIPDEQQIVITADGTILLNDLTMAEPGDKEMLRLLQTLIRFREASEANNARALVTLIPDDASKHQRIIDVLNICAQAQITGVTFSGAGEQES